MKIPEVKWEIIETISEEIKKSSKNPEALIKIVSEFNQEQPTLAFFLGGLIDTLTEHQRGQNVLLTCNAVLYKAIKSVLESHSLNELFKKKE